MQVVGQIESIWVTMKSNKHVKDVVKMFEHETKAGRFVRKICCVEDEVLDHVEFED